jgi:cell shape-determining protein MreD
MIIMRQFLFYCAGVFAAIYFQSLVYALTPPFQLINIFSGIIILSMLLKSYKHSIILGVIFGFLHDILNVSIIGVSSVLFLIGISVVMVVQSTLLTHNNRVSILLLILLFHTLITVFTSNHRFPSFPIAQEALVIIVINTCISFVILLIFQFAQRQLEKRFL